MCGVRPLVAGPTSLGGPQNFIKPAPLGTMWRGRAGNLTRTIPAAVALPLLFCRHKFVA